MKRIIGLAALALAACDNGPEMKVRNTAAPSGGGALGQGRLAAAVPPRLTPGEWQLTMQTLLVDAKGVPDEAVAKLKTAYERSMTETQCLTPEQASRPLSEILAKRQNSRCSFESFDMAGGKITGRMICPGGRSGQMAMAMNGTYTPTRYTLDADMDVKSFDGTQSMKMTIRSVGSRTGECAAKPKAT